MKKAIIELLDVNSLEPVAPTSHILKLEDDASVDDLLDQIHQIETSTGMVCNDWSWCKSA